VTSPAAVDGQDRAGQVGGPWVCEQQGRAREFFGCGPATHRDLDVEEALHMRVVVDSRVERRTERPRGERVHRAACASKLDGEAASELDDGALAGRLPGTTGAAYEAEGAGQGENAAVPGIAHGPGRCAAGEPGSHHVDLQARAQIGGGQLVDGPPCLYARAGYQHVKPTVGGQHAIDQAGDVVLVGDIAAVAERGAACLAAQPPGCLLAALRRTAGKHQGRPGLGKRAGYHQPESGRAACRDAQCAV